MLIVTVTTILAQQRMDQMWGDQQAKNKETTPCSFIGAYSPIWEMYGMVKHITALENG